MRHVIRLRSIILSLMTFILQDFIQIFLLTSNPKTSCTEAPFVIMVWHAWLTKRKSNTPSITIRAAAERQEYKWHALKWCNNHNDECKWGSLMSNAINFKIQVQLKNLHVRKMSLQSSFIYKREVRGTCGAAEHRLKQIQCYITHRELWSGRPRRYLDSFPSKNKINNEKLYPRLDVTSQCSHLKTKYENIFKR